MMMGKISTFFLFRVFFECVDKYMVVRMLKLNFIFDHWIQISCK